MSGKIKRMQRHTNMWRAMASKYAGRLGFQLSWSPLSSNLGKLRAQEHDARFGSRYWHHRYLHIIALVKSTKANRARASHDALQIGHRLDWRTLSYIPSKAARQHASAVRKARLWHRRYVANLRTRKVLTLQQLHILVWSFNWPHASAWYIIGAESTYNRLARNGEHHGYLQLSHAIRTRYRIGEGFWAGPNIVAGYKNFVSAGRHFCPQWTTACSAGIP